MQRLKFILFVFAVITANLSLAQDFASLSPKERIALAEREEEDAARDEAYMQLMQQGHQLFKERHYLKAIQKYQLAGNRRPFNVYPKVIIADIELSMKDTLATLRAAENKAKESKPVDSNPPQEFENQPKPVDIPKETPEQRLAKVNEWEAQERKKREDARQNEQTVPAPMTETSLDVPKMSTADYQKELGSKYPSGITEEIYTLGNKTITRRIVVADGVGNDYKKVVHNWGGVFFFKNGEAVTERVWAQDTQ